MQPEDTQTVHPSQLEIQDFSSYSLVIDARSPREFAEDHVPGAINLPVVNDDEYAQVGTRHRYDKHGAYLIGVEYSLQNIAAQIKLLISQFSESDCFLVYCFRGGKRSRLWADNLRIIGFQVDVINGGWKNYRRWVRTGLEVLPKQFLYRVLSGSTGTGKTRLLSELHAIGEQVIDLEALASHRGSLIGSIPGQEQPTQKYFDSLLLDRMRRLDPSRPVWIEAESKKIGQVQLPESLFLAMHRSKPIHVSAPMTERVRLWKEDYPQFVQDPTGMVAKLAPLKPMVGGLELAAWVELAANGHIEELFERVMVSHYDPCYSRSTRRSYREAGDPTELPLQSLELTSLRIVARNLQAQFGVMS
jgi:tRNA 2-selenouridine synthase